MSQAQTDPADDGQSSRAWDALQSDEGSASPPPPNRTPSRGMSPRADAHRRSGAENAFDRAAVTRSNR